MKNLSCNFILVLCLGMVGEASFAKTKPLSSSMSYATFKPSSATKAQWMFMGTVNTEGGDTYGYYFSLDKNGTHGHVITALIDQATQSVVFFEDKTQDIEKINDHHFSIGETFLRFNPINNRWVLGLKHKDKSGFNFKIDMLKPEEARPNVDKTHPGVAYYVTKIRGTNGHIKRSSGEKEQFVTANQTWFFQSYTKSKKIEPFASLFCSLDNGAGFYLISPQSTHQSAFKGWLDEQDKVLMMSSSINTQKIPPSSWRLDMAYPKTHYQLKDNLQETGLMIGFIEKGGKGFCLQTQTKL